MKRVAFGSTLVLVPSIALSALAQGSSSDNAAPRHTVVALSGTAAPAGGNYLPLSFFTVSMNARHEVAFDAIVSGPPLTLGVFAGNGRTTSAIAFGTNPDPSAPSFGFVSNPFITNSGDVMFDVNETDIFASNGRMTSAIVRAGDPAPGGGTLSPGLGTRVVNEHGAVAYTASIAGAAATHGIFRSDSRGTTSIVRDDAVSPTGGVFSLLSQPAMNEHGQVAFFSEMRGGAADFGVFRGEGGELTPIFVSGRSAPGTGGATFSDFGDPLINRHGDVASFALLSNSTSRLGLFRGDGTNTIAIAIEGQAAPKAGSYGDAFGRDAFQGPLRFNDRGEVAFDARLTGGTGTSGIFRGDGVRTAAIALAGTLAPGTTATFSSFDDFVLGVDGRVAFIGTLTLGVDGVDVTNNRGIWVGASDEDLQLVVRTGDVIDGRVLTRLPQFAQAGQFAMNENAILWVGNFGSTKGVVISRVAGKDE